MRPAITLKTVMPTFLPTDRLPGTGSSSVGTPVLIGCVVIDASLHEGEERRARFGDPECHPVRVERHRCES